ncbi:dTDP-4-amino-4,6-dideoxygalactose transaminase [Anaerobacterium chartisolvens]|uniref:dTDP-4-amino-4,6-dideoxygalactose transaminase n=1 Tax=Anaerobacterium chartisolvens TaxID=1297424 RepID=A0A369B6C4_9FIRM|nr:DegT/DnrJ/EryC1/StrS family aminotransferase [Anaerobacterium chartisolvens]RCX16875.1 dTDP-4-amino-4,6-dideoxygalactose transaminase [Anaerobacterium chartisolvens]
MAKAKAFSQPVYVTSPLLPDLDDMNKMLSSIWRSGQLTNNGSMAVRLEKELADFLGANNLSLFSNGTVALQLACRLLRLSGEVITTPFTFAATCHALSWSNLTPVFCDIEEDTFNINPKEIEKLITANTTAIMPVHVFGNPCRVEEIHGIAKKHGLRVIYDAAHAFGVEAGGKPIGCFGDISMFSLHATKLYHTIEGGALTFNDPYLKQRADSLRNFGILNEELIIEPGTNAKLNEVQAAVGILLLAQVDKEIEGRKAITGIYRSLLKDVPGIRFFEEAEGVKYNYPYFVIEVNENEFGISRDMLYERLKEHNVFARKYFYPLCSRFPCYKSLPSAAPGRLPVAEKIVERVMSLPLHGRLPQEYAERICAIIKGV